MWKDEQDLDTHVKKEVDKAFAKSHKRPFFYLRRTILLGSFSLLLLLLIAAFVKNPSIDFDRNKAFCFMDRDIQCAHNRIGRESINLTLANNMNEDIKLYNISIGNCSLGAESQDILRARRVYEVSVPCNTSLFFKEEVRIEYMKEATGSLRKLHKGTLQYGIDYHGIERFYHGLWLQTIGVLGG